VRVTCQGPTNCSVATGPMTSTYYRRHPAGIGTRCSLFFHDRCPRLSSLVWLSHAGEAVNLQSAWRWNFARAVAQPFLVLCRLSCECLVDCFVGCLETTRRCVQRHRRRNRRNEIGLRRVTDVGDRQPVRFRRCIRPDCNPYCSLIMRRHNGQKRRRRRDLDRNHRA